MKQEIINNIKKANLDKVELDDSAIELTTYEDKIQAFNDSLQKAGGKAFEIKKDMIPQKIKELFSKDKKILSFAKDIDMTNVDIKDIKEPKDLQDIDIAIIDGRFGVAENGSVWCDDSDIPFRAVYFIVKTLILIIQKENIVNNMQEAYEKLDTTSSNFGVFISGPSKTADIEQSLVFGAHGAMEQIAFIF